jgi:hypothetical protein
VIVNCCPKGPNEQSPYQARLQARIYEMLVFLAQTSKDTPQFLEQASLDLLHLFEKERRRLDSR